MSGLNINESTAVTALNLMSDEIHRLNTNLDQVKKALDAEYKRRNKDFDAITNILADTPLDPDIAYSLHKQIKAIRDTY